MSLLNPFKLEKLKIASYANNEWREPPQKVIPVMFNPASFSMRHKNSFGGPQGRGTGATQETFSNSRPDQLSLEFVFDGTGVSDLGLLTLLGGGAPSVSEQIAEFLEACFTINGEIHEPNYLIIKWGDGPLKNFKCRLESVEITYSVFDKNGAPLRATLRTEFFKWISSAEQARLNPLSSPDLSHHRMMHSGDTLPLLCQKIYGSPDYYLRVAEANGLDDFRHLVPGQELVFPPMTGVLPAPTTGP